MIFGFENIEAQVKTNVYCFPGQGSDARLFDSIKLDSNYEKKVIEYGTPAKGQSMKDFAKDLVLKIDTSSEFILVGVSLGGMICTELSKILKPRATILISSAENSKELPWRYRFQKVIPLYKLIPKKLVKLGAKILQPVVEPDRNKNKEVFKSMIASKDPVYLKRTIEMIIGWEREYCDSSIIRIHGDNDHTIPHRNINKIDYLIKDGSHMMTLTRGDEISRILNDVLNNLTSRNSL